MGSLQANAYHSITIGDKNTWDDWHLVPTSRPTFAMPRVKTNYVDIPGSDGILDLSTALTGRPTYSNRQGSFEFLVINDYGRWYDRYSEIANYLHGKEFKAILDDEPQFYYEGRFSVNEWRSEKDWSKIVIDYNVGPYKKTTMSPGERWLWDPFYFGNPSMVGVDKGDFIQNYKKMVVNNTTANPLTIRYIGDIYESAPVFKCSKYSNKNFSVSVTFNGKTKSLKAGTNVVDDFHFVEGENILTFSGVGVVTLETTGGRL